MSKPEMIEVVSSQMTHVGYDRDQAELYVTFKGGATYVYSAVPSVIYKSLMEAESCGKFLNANIKGLYEYRKLEQ